MAAQGPSPPPLLIPSPCAACKVLRRRCRDNKCVLAPYFPPSEPLKFAVAHRVFGASNIIKMLKGLPEDCRADAVNSMVYEANARLRDPVYGSAGIIYKLQQQTTELQAELAKAQAQVMFNMQTGQSSNSSHLLFEDHRRNDQEIFPQSMPPVFYGDFTAPAPDFMLGENDCGVAWVNIFGDDHEFGVDPNN